MKRFLFLSAALCALLSPFSIAATGTVAIQAREAWIRWLPANIPSGAYVTLINPGGAPQILVGAVSPDFAQISFHQTRTVNGMSEMNAVDKLTVASQSSLRFAPGGYHMMLMQPRRALHPGDQVPITLHFADGNSLLVLFEVRSADADAPAPSRAMEDMPGMQH
jgi:copper(I)-binding protein